ncbi:MAG TPA: hypothetical protein EYP19_05105 [Desulfobacterales bacterium]|nr:hypothetical protein [Desulfobacterales bacterium]
MAPMRKVYELKGSYFFRRHEEASSFENSKLCESQYARTAKCDGILEERDVQKVPVKTGMK